MNSLNRAAENLFIAQPNLSRILKDIEKDVGFAIFDRHSDGVVPTERGSEYLKHIHRIIFELEAAKQLRPSDGGYDRLRICIPRSATWFDCIMRFLADNNALGKVNAAIHENHARRTLELMSKSNVGIGIIRVRSEYVPHFEKQVRVASLNSRKIGDIDFRITSAKGSALALIEKPTMEILRSYPEISHSDDYFLPNRRKGSEAGKFYITERQAQLSMLHTIPDVWMWAEPMSEGQLDQYGLVQAECADQKNAYTDLLIYGYDKILTEIESKLLAYLKAK